MDGTIRTNQKCPICGNKFKGYPLKCQTCLTTPNRYYIDISWYGNRQKIYSGKDGFVFDSWARVERALYIVRAEIDKGDFNPDDYNSGNINALLFQNYVKEWFKRRQALVDIGELSKEHHRISIGLVKKHIIPFYLDKNIREIYEGSIEDFHINLPKILSSKSRKNILSILESILRDAFRRRDISRVPSFPKIKVQTPEIKWIDIETQNRILSFVECQVYKAYFNLLISTGIRPSEGRSLCFEHCDFKNNKITIKSAMDGNKFRETTKTKRVRTLPVYPEVMDMLKALPYRGISGYVFIKRGNPLNNKGIYKAWNKACKLAGVDISLYQGSKHSLACQFLNLPGAKLETLQKQFGHCELKTTERYAKLRDESLLDIFRVRGVSADLKIAKNNQ